MYKKSSCASEKKSSHPLMKKVINEPWYRYFEEDMEYLDPDLSLEDAKRMYSDYSYSFHEEGKEIPESRYLCVSCGSNRVFSRTVQVRRSDEGATTYYVCSNSHVHDRVVLRDSPF
jgi:DNA-directed RNA polymerase subunit M/transcription elongation factor TFIIS